MIEEILIWEDKVVLGNSDFYNNAMLKVSIGEYPIGTRFRRVALHRDVGELVLFLEDILPVAVYRVKYFIGERVR